MGVGALARARGYAFSKLSSQQRGAFGSQKRFEQAARESMVRSPSAPAAAAIAPAPAGPEKPKVSDAQESAKEALREQGRREVQSNAMPSSRFEGRAPAGHLEVYESGRTVGRRSSSPSVPSDPNAAPRVRDFNWTPEQMAKARRNAGGVGAKYTATGRPKTW